jgi:hypothetical protein
LLQEGFDFASVQFAPKRLHAISRRNAALREQFPKHQSGLLECGVFVEQSVASDDEVYDGTSVAQS